MKCLVILNECYGKTQEDVEKSVKLSELTAAQSSQCVVFLTAENTSISI